MSNVIFDNINRDGEQKEKRKPLIRRPVARILAFALSFAVFIGIAGFGITLGTTEGDALPEQEQEIEANIATIELPNFQIGGGEATLPTEGEGETEMSNLEPDPSDIVPNRAVQPGGSNYGVISLGKTVDGDAITSWIDDTDYEIDDLIECFNLYSVNGDGADIEGLDPIDSTTIDEDGLIIFTGLDDGWYAIEEVLTEEGRLTFQKAPIKYILITNGVAFGSSAIFGYSAFYTIENGYGSGYVLGYPGLNNSGDIFPIAVINDDTGVIYHSFCAYAGSRAFAGQSGLDCGGYMVANKTELENYEAFLKAYNYIEDNFVDGVNYFNLNDLRPIVQIITWILLHDDITNKGIDYPSAYFDGIDWGLIESGSGAIKGVPDARAKVIEVMEHYNDHPGKGSIIDVIYMLCEKHHDPYNCQPQLVPIYGKNGFDNKFEPKGELELTGTKKTNIVVSSDEVLEFTFTMLDVTGVDLTDLSEEDIAELDLEVVSTGHWTPGNSIVFDTITYDLSDAGKKYVYRIKEDASLPDGWTPKTPYILIYVAVDANGYGPLSVTAYSDQEYKNEITDLEKYLTFINEYGKEYDAALRKWVSDVNGVVGDEDEIEDIDELIAANPLIDVAGILRSRSTANNSEPSPSVRVAVGDLVEYTIRVFNQCEEPLKVVGIWDNVPAGLKFIDDPDVNPGWTIVSDDKIYYDWSDLDPDDFDEIPPILYPELAFFDFSAGPNPEDQPYYYDVKVVMEVLSSARYGADIINSAMIKGITDKDGNEVPDIDSDFKEEWFDGLEDEGYDGVDDNYVKGDGTKGEDKDEHDIAKVFLLGNISVEVFKDTIKRTSAAFDGTNVGVNTGIGTANESPINNVTGPVIENYRYDVSFRSTSNVDVDEFVVEDPLEAVNYGLIRVENVWTPATWGDMDGVMAVWYKSKKNTGINIPGDPGVYDFTVGPQLFPANRDAPDNWRLWAIIDGKTFDEETKIVWSAEDPIIDRVNLGLPFDPKATEATHGYDYDPDDYITALRFEFGAVSVGFTSRNTDTNGKTTMNEGLQDDGVRFTNGTSEEDPLLDDLLPPDDPANAVWGSYTAPENSQIQAYSALAGASFGNGQFAPFQQVVDNVPTYQQAAPCGDIPDKGDSADWGPDPERSDFPHANGDSLMDATLKPITYLVSATMSSEDMMKEGSGIPLDLLVDDNGDIVVVSSATAYISKAVQTNETLDIYQVNYSEVSLYDRDRDGVLTRFIVPFSFTSDPANGTFTRDRGETNDIRFEGAQLIDGIWYDRDGNRITTWDAFTLSFWLVLIACAAICLTLLIRSFVLTPGRKGKNKEIVPGVEKGGGM